MGSTKLLSFDTGSCRDSFCPATAFISFGECLLFFLRMSMGTGKLGLCLRPPSCTLHVDTL